ncbi:MAG: hypothetical protein KatS3mg051_1517 [Anaerolineae bacterium]|nr:MAG: hypothetical protein KatS3mg051_1517 [Anaerolineae bacterium]
MECVHLPGRPQSHTGTREFERWRARVRQRMREAGITPIAQPHTLALECRLYYAVNQDVTYDLAALGIPRITAATEALLIAMTGVLYERRNQIDTLIIQRCIMAPEALAAQHGEAWRDGGCTVRWEVD